MPLGRRGAQQPHAQPALHPVHTPVLRTPDDRPPTNVSQLQRRPMAATKAERDERGCLRNPKPQTNTQNRANDFPRGRGAVVPVGAEALAVGPHGQRPFRRPNPAPVRSGRRRLEAIVQIPGKGSPHPSEEPNRVMQQPPETERGCLNLAVGSGLGDGVLLLGLGRSGHYKWRLGSGLGWVMGVWDQG